MKPCHFTIYSKPNENNNNLAALLKEEMTKKDFIFDEKNPTLVLVLGGDGSLLRAIHDRNLPRGENVSYLLFNTGHLGFYSDYALGQEKKFLRALFSVEPYIEKLPFFTLMVDGKQKHHFINDIALQTGETVFMDIFIDDEPLTESRNNGIVVGTPTGSSGYLLSLNSPVVIKANNIYQYSLISPCHNRLFPNTITKAILGGDQVLKVVIKYGDFDIYVDGGHKANLKGHEFTFSHNNNECINLLHLNYTTTISRLRKNISGKD